MRGLLQWRRSLWEESPGRGRMERLRSEFGSRLLARFRVSLLLRLLQKKRLYSLIWLPLHLTAPHHPNFPPLDPGSNSKSTLSLSSSAPPKPTTIRSKTRMDSTSSTGLLLQRCAILLYHSTSDGESSRLGFFTLAFQNTRRTASACRQYYKAKKASFDDKIAELQGGVVPGGSKTGRKEEASG